MDRDTNRRNNSYFFLDVEASTSYLSIMRTKSEQLSPLTRLLIQWLALWQAANACGRTMNMVAKFNPMRAAREAEQLELWSRFALFALLDQIAALGPPQTQEDAATSSRLYAIAGALAALNLLAAKVRRECAGRALVWTAYREISDVALDMNDIATRPQPAIQDSS